MSYRLPLRRRIASPDATGAGGEAPQVLDATAMARLRELDPDGTKGFVRQILATYEASLTRHLKSLESIDATRELKVAAEVAHTLKSSSASVGALEFSSRCARVEKAAKDGDSGELVPALAALRSEAERVLAAVRAML